MITPKLPIERLYNIVYGAQPSDVSFGYNPAAELEHTRYANEFRTLADKYIGGYTGKPEDLEQDVDQSAAAVADLLNDRGPILGYVAAMREGAKASEALFRSGLDSITGDNSGVQVNQNRERALRDNTIDLTNPDTRLVGDLFPSGNWLLHSTNTERISAIVNRGAILPTMTLAKSVNTAEHSKGGSFGLSYNFNRLGVLVGTPRHEAGFIADAGTLLTQGGILAVPFKSTRYEVQYYNAPEDRLQDIRDLELSLGALEGIGQMGAHVSRAVTNGYAPEDDSVLVENDRKQASEAVQAVAKQLENPGEVRKCFIITSKGTFEFSSMIFKEEFTATSALLQAGLDGHFGTDIQSHIQSTINRSGLAAAIAGPMAKAYAKVYESYSAAYKELEASVSEKTVAKTNDMLFYCPKKDYERWVKALSRSPNAPKGVVVYDVPSLRSHTSFNADMHYPPRDQFSKQLEALRSNDAIDWNTFFDDAPVVDTHARHLIDPLQTGIAGFLALEDSKLVQKTIDDIE